MEKVPNEVLERIFDLLDPLGAFTCEKVWTVLLEECK